jgi:hypothetical protein
MLVIRNVFQCKPGQAKALVKKFKETVAQAQMTRTRVLTDVAAPFWTVVFEVEAESLGAWEQEFERMSARADLRKPMEGYMELVECGRREIFRIE